MIDLSKSLDLSPNTMARFEAFFQCYYDQHENGLKLYKSKLDPMKFRHLLGCVILYEFDSVKSLKINLIGGTLHTLFGKGFKGQIVSDLLEDNDAAVMLDTLRPAVSNYCGWYNRYQFYFDRVPHFAVRVHSLGLPLLDNNENIRYFLALLDLEFESENQLIKLKDYCEQYNLKTRFDGPYTPLDIGFGIPQS